MAAAMDELRRRRHFVDDDYTSAPPLPRPCFQAGGGACMRAGGPCAGLAGRERARQPISWLQQLALRKDIVHAHAVMLRGQSLLAPEASIC